MGITTPRRGRRLIATIAVAVGAVGIAGCGSDDDSGGNAASKADVTTFRTVWAAPISTPGLFNESVANGLGMMKEHGVELDHLTSPSGAALLRAGQTEMASIDIPAMVEDNAKNGDKNDLVSIFNSAPGPVARFSVMPDSPITSFCDLKGKTVGTYSPAATGLPFLRAALRECGMNPDRDVKVVTVPPGPGIKAALEGNKVDAYVGFDSLQHQTEEALGKKLRALPLPENLKNAQGAAYVVDRAALEKNRDVYVGYLRAVLSAQAFAMENPKAAATVMVDENPELLTPGTSREDAIANVQSQIEGTFGRFDVPKEASSDPRLFGYQWEAQWEPFANAEFGASFPAIKGKTAEFFSNDVVEEAYDGLDLEAVKDRAKNWQDEK